MTTKINSTFLIASLFALILVPGISTSFAEVDANGVTIPGTLDRTDPVEPSVLCDDYTPVIILFLIIIILLIIVIIILIIICRRK